MINKRMKVKNHLLKEIKDIKQNKYFEWYCSIIERAREWSPQSDFEDHHYVPKAIIDNDNTVPLSYKEHFVCHLLLPKFLKGNNRRKMLHAINLMIDINKYDQSNSRLYESLKQDLKYARYRPIDLIRHSYMDGSFAIEVRPKGKSSDKNGEVISTFDSIDDLFATPATIVYHPSNSAKLGYVPVMKHSYSARAAIGAANSVHQKGEGNSQYGTQWIYSDEEKRSKKIRVTDDIPKGWNKGRKIKFEDNNNE